MRVNKGFTLIELMIVVAIVAIIAAIALPSYQEQVRRGKRADGKAFLLDIASRQERLYSEKLSYSKDVTAATGLNYASIKSPEGKYSVAIVTTPANCGPAATVKCTGFTATVKPIPVTGDPKCATLTYNHLGVKGHSGTGTVEECWK